mgnify:CR=1 FL=1
MKTSIKCKLFGHQWKTQLVDVDMSRGDLAIQCLRCGHRLMSVPYRRVFAQPSSPSTTLQSPGSTPLA